MWPFKKKEISQGEMSGSSPDALIAIALSDIGSVRDNNEDNYLLGSKMNAHSQARSFCAIRTEADFIAGVFDGMGGGEAGEIASLCAAQAFLSAAEDLREESTTEEIDFQLRSAFQEANNSVINEQKQLRVLGTTGTIIYRKGNKYKIYHLGDSRAYLLRHGSLQQLTRDQTLAQMKIELKLYKAGSAEAEIEKHQLTEFIGRDWTKENLRPVESAWMQLLPGDILLLCSDGLYDCCSDDEIKEILVSGLASDKMAEALIKAANERGGIDNITVIVLCNKLGE